MTATPPSELRGLEAEVRTERAARERLEAILDGVADAVIVHDGDGRLVFANRAAVDLLGYPDAAALLAADPEELPARFNLQAADRRPLAIDELPSRRALRGEDPEEVVVRYRAAGARRERWARVKARPLRGDDGDVELAITVIEDITEIKQAEYAQGFLAEASRVLGGSLDYESTLARVAELAVPEIADWCAVDLVAGEAFERVSVQHVDPAKVALAHRLAERYPPERREDRGMLHVVCTAESELYPEIPEELLAEAAVDAEHLELLQSLGMSSAMAVPIRVRGDVLGVLTFVSAESGRRFGPHDLALAEDLGLRAGTAIQNARLFRERSVIAHTLQASLLPPELPEIEQIECAALFRAAGEGYEVGGDFYDVFSTADDEWFAVIGDVCGKGPQAAATTGLVRYTVRAAAVRRRSPAAILRWVNDAMLRQETDTGRFCTIAIVRLDVGADGVRATCAVGGHPPPRILRGDGAVEDLGGPGTLVGVMTEVEFVEGTALLSPGDALVLFTDGLTEARAPDRVWSGEEVDAALSEARAAAGDSLQRLIDQVAAAALGDIEADPRDDVAILALRAR